MATHAAKECIWLRCLIGKLFPSLIRQTTLYCDNQVALKLVTDNNYHVRTKHIDIRYHFIHQVVASAAIDITVKLKAIEFHTIKRRNGEFNIFYV